MTDALAGQIITGAVTLGVAFFGYLKLKAGQKNLQGKVDDYHKEVDGKVSQLLVVSGDAREAIGKLAGAAQQKDESATTAADVVTAIKKDPDIDLTKK